MPATRAPAPSPAEMSDCQAWGHEMDPLGGPPAGYPSPWVDGWHVWLRCERCSAVRVVVLGSTSGKVTYSRYWLPAGYALARDEDGPRSIPEKRLAWLAAQRATPVHGRAVAS